MSYKMSYVVLTVKWWLCCDDNTVTI